VNNGGCSVIIPAGRSPRGGPSVFSSMGSRSATSATSGLRATGALWFVRSPNDRPHFFVVLARWEGNEPAVLDQNFGHGYCALSISCSGGSAPHEISHSHCGARPAVYQPVKALVSQGRFVIGWRDDRLQQWTSGDRPFWFLVDCLQAVFYSNAQKYLYSSSSFFVVVIAALTFDVMSSGSLASMVRDLL